MSEGLPKTAHTSIEGDCQDRSTGHLLVFRPARHRRPAEPGTALRQRLDEIVATRQNLVRCGPRVDLGLSLIPMDGE